jgi:hypothetical protein
MKPPGITMLVAVPGEGPPSFSFVHLFAFVIISWLGILGWGFGLPSPLARIFAPTTAAGRAFQLWTLTAPPTYLEPLLDYAATLMRHNIFRGSTRVVRAQSSVP